MKNKKLHFLALLSVPFLLFSCSKFNTEWSSNENVHWHSSTDPNNTSTADLGEHQFDEDGVCTVCGYKKDGDFLVIFDTKGGTSISPQKVLSDHCITKPQDPTLLGHSFYRWCEDEELTKEFDFSKKINNDITLYADYIANQMIFVNYCYQNSNNDNDKVEFSYEGRLDYVDWGDGNINSETWHSFNSNSRFTIYGEITSISFNNAEGNLLRAGNALISDITIDSSSIKNIPSKAFANLNNIGVLTIPFNNITVGSDILANTGASICCKFPNGEGMEHFDPNWAGGRPVTYIEKNLDTFTDGDFEYRLKKDTSGNIKACILRYIGTETHVGQDDFILPATATKKVKGKPNQVYEVFGIESRAFQGKTNFKNVIIPENYVQLNDNAFGSNNSELKIFVKSPRENYNLKSHWNANYPVYYNYKEFATEDGLFTYVITNSNEITIVRNLDETSDEITIPETLNGKKITEIGDCSFKGLSNIKKVHLSNNIKVIGCEAFMNTANLREYPITAFTEYLGRRAFKETPAITTNHLVMPPHIKYIGYQAFFGRFNYLITFLEIPDFMPTLESGCFSDIDFNPSSDENRTHIYCSERFFNATYRAGIDLVEFNATSHKFPYEFYKEGNTYKVCVLEQGEKKSIIEINTTLDVDSFYEEYLKMLG